MHDSVYFPEIKIREECEKKAKELLTINQPTYQKAIFFYANKIQEIELPKKD